MFTGIVETKCEVVGFERIDQGARLVISFSEEAVAGLKAGASVSVDGVCLTVAEMKKHEISFDLMAATLEATTLGGLKIGDLVNIERSLKAGDEIGGHEVSGHVDGTAEIVSVKRNNGDVRVIFKAPKSLMPYFLPKGFIAVNGVSLTIQKADREKKIFEVGLIPETLKRTTFDSKGEGDKVNLEINRQTQAIVDTTRAFLESLLPADRQLEKSVRALIDSENK